VKPGKLPPDWLGELLAWLPTGDPRVLLGPRLGHPAILHQVPSHHLRVLFPAPAREHGREAGHRDFHYADPPRRMQRPEAPLTGCT